MKYHRIILTTDDVLASKIEQMESEGYILASVYPTGKEWIKFFTTEGEKRFVEVRAVFVVLKQLRK